MQQSCGGLLLVAGLDGVNTLHCTKGTMAPNQAGSSKPLNLLEVQGYS